jgi:hypothetical protein
MRVVILGAALAMAAAPAFADELVSGYVKKNGTYVAPHYRTTPNSTNTDNYSTKPNTNPYTGQPGTVAPDYTYKPPAAPKPPKAPKAPAYKPYKPPKF